MNIGTVPERVNEIIRSPGTVETVRQKRISATYADELFALLIIAGAEMVATKDMAIDPKLHIVLASVYDGYKGDCKLKIYPTDIRNFFRRKGL